MTPKQRVRGRPFPKGVCPHRCQGGKPFAKYGQRFSSRTPEMLLSLATDEEAASVGLPPGSPYLDCVIKAAILDAMDGDSEARRWLLAATETAKIRVEQVSYNVNVFQQAREQLIEAMSQPQPQLPQEVET